MTDHGQTHSRKSQIRRWLIVFASVIVAMPVVMWALVTVVRSYVTPARVPIYRPAAIAATDAPKTGERPSTVAANPPATQPNPRAVAADPPTTAAVAALAAGLSKAAEPPVAAHNSPPAPADARAPAAIPPPMPLSSAASREAFASPVWQESLARAPAQAAAAPIPMPPLPPVQAQRPQPAQTPVQAPTPSPADPALEQRAAAQLPSVGERSANTVRMPPRRPREVTALAGGVPVPRPRPSDAPTDAAAGDAQVSPVRDHNQF